MTAFVVYSLDKGVILRTGTAPENMISIQAHDGEGVLIPDIPVSDITHYVDVTSSPPTLVPLNVITATLNNLTLTGLPIPCAITVENVIYTVSDGEAELTFTLPGTYPVRVEALHYIPRTYKVTAT